MDKINGISIDSWLVSGGRPGNPGDPINTPIVPASNFKQRRMGDRETTQEDPIYSREDGTASWRSFEEVVGGLEGGDALAFSSGMAAASAVFSALPVGSHILLPEDCYQGVIALVEQGVAHGRWTVDVLPIEDTQRWRRSLPQADLAWLESPSNPLLAVGDLPEICQGERKEGGLVAVDNTFATCLNQRPLEFGADVSMHSATKFMGGHSDLLCGVTICRDRRVFDRLHKARSVLGATPGALESFLALRGLRTMALRVRRAEASAGELARRLFAHSEVELVRYPGLPDDPGHAVASRTLKGFGAILSFDVKGGAARADAVCHAVRLVTHATSLGGVETTMERRAAHAGQAKIPPNLIRVSVGCESVEDLWADLLHALEETT